MTNENRKGVNKYFYLHGEQGPVIFNSHMYQKLKTGSDPECMCVKKPKNTRDHNLK